MYSRIVASKIKREEKSEELNVSWVFFVATMGAKGKVIWKTRVTSKKQWQKKFYENGKYEIILMLKVNFSECWQKKKRATQMGNEKKI